MKKFFMPKDWNMFDKCYCGIVKHRFLNENVRFLTLTSSLDSVKGVDKKDYLGLIQKHFRVLKRRYEIDFAKRNERGYIDEYADFGEYFSIRCSTKRGLPHMHILFVGKYIPHSWISKNWDDIHKASVIDIRQPRGDPFNGAMYVIGQYVVGQLGKKIFGYSRNWIFDGFTKCYTVLRSSCKDMREKIMGSSGFLYYPMRYALFREVLQEFVEFCFLNLTTSTDSYFENTDKPLYWRYSYES